MSAIRALCHDVFAGELPVSDSDSIDRSSMQERLLLRRIELSAAPIGRLINVISLIAGLIALVVIGSVIAITILDKEIPPELSNWGGIILGFYFGQFINLVKDYIGIVQINAQPRAGENS